jgi:hypothetical protein
LHQNNFIDIETPFLIKSTPEAMKGATEAILLGDFNNWNPESAPRLEKQSDGSFKAVALLEVGKTYHYRFLVDNSKWVNDYHAQRYEAAPGYYTDNCVITVLESVSEKNKFEESAAPKKVSKKADTASRELTKPAKGLKSVAAKTSKKAAPKTKAVKTKETKSAKTKSVNEKAQKAEKMTKAVKKESPKEDK